MRILNEEQIVALFGVSRIAPQDEFTSGRYAGLSSEITEALARKQAHRKQEQAEVAADAIIAILDSYEDNVEAVVAEIRNLRKQEQALKDKLEALNLARSYAEETNNFLPLAKKTGLPVVTLSALFTREVLPAGAADVPADWKPKVVKPKAEAKK